MVTRNSWATAAEVEAAAILLNCNIHVILEGRNIYISQAYSSSYTFSETIANFPLYMNKSYF
jgi:hypothetical protein